MDTTALEQAGVQLGHIKLEADAAASAADSLVGLVGAPPAGIGIARSVNAAAEAWAEAFTLLGSELQELGTKVQQSATVYALVEKTATGYFTGHPAI